MFKCVQTCNKPRPLGCTHKCTKPCWEDCGPSPDHANRLVCIARDLSEKDIAATLPALNAAAGTQATYSMRELQERQAQQ